MKSPKIRWFWLPIRAVYNRDALSQRRQYKKDNHAYKQYWTDEERELVDSGKVMKYLGGSKAIVIHLVTKQPITTVLKKLEGNFICATGPNFHILVSSQIGVYETAVLRLFHGHYISFGNLDCHKFSTFSEGVVRPLCMSCCHQIKRLSLDMSEPCVSQKHWKDRVIYRPLWDKLQLDKEQLKADNEALEELILHYQSEELIQ